MDRKLIIAGKIFSDLQRSDWANHNCESIEINKGKVRLVFEDGERYDIEIKKV